MTAHLNHQALEAIASLQRPNKPDLLGRIIELFKSESPKAVATIQEALESGELLQVRNAAHTLKSSSAYVGAQALADRCRDLEVAARDDNYTACIVLGDGLDELFVDTCQHLDLYLSAHLKKAA